MLNSFFIKEFAVKENNTLGFLLFDSKDEFAIKYETTKQDKLKKNILSKNLTNWLFSKEIRFCPR